MKRYKRILASLLAGVLVMNIAATDILVKAAESGNGIGQVEETNPTDDTQNKEDSVEKDDSAINGESQESDKTDENSGDTQTDMADQTEQEEEPVTEEPASNEIEVMAASEDGTLNLADILGEPGIEQSGTTVTVTSPQALVLVSNCKSADLEDKTINISASAPAWKLYFSGTDIPAIWGGVTYTYHPIGTEKHPFAGAFIVTGSKGVTIQTKNTIFGALSSQASVNTMVNIQWDGDGSIPILAEYYVIEGEDARIPFKINNATGGLIGAVSGNGTLTINDEVTYRTFQHNVIRTGNAGLICDTLSEGTIALGEKYSYPRSTSTENPSWNVTSTNGNAGGLIGEMKKNTKLVVNSALATDEAGLNITSSGGDAGGLVGKMESGAEIETNAEITLNKPTIKGKSNAGGIAGEVEDALFENVKITVQGATVTGDADGANVGGYIGQYTLNSKTGIFPANILITNPILNISTGSTTYGNAGGYFGKLILNNSSTYKFPEITDKSDKSDKFEVTLDKAAKVNAYGAIAGSVEGNSGTTNSIIIENQKIESRADGKPFYNGGLIGVVGAKDSSNKAVYAEISGSITVFDPFAGFTYGFGGAVSYLGKGSVLKVEAITVATGKRSTNDPNIWEGGGIVGYADAGSAIEFSGTTDLSNVYYTGRNCVGQLVGYQDSALIYARGDGNGDGWKYIRQITSGLPEVRGGFGQSAQVNDIGNYGEVIRLKNGEASEKGLDSSLIQMDATTHQVTVKQLPAGVYQSDTITLDSVDAFALLAITWNSQGYFSADTNMDANISGNSDNWKKLYQKNIVITQDINLTGTGIIGLTRDNDKSNTYTGSITGNNQTVMLAIGESYGVIRKSLNSEEIDKATGAGSGILYCYGEDYHSRLGIFARTRGSISDLTIAGSIQFSNKYGDEVSWGIARAGGIAGELAGNDDNPAVSVSGVTVAETITMISGLKETRSNPNTNTNRTIIAGGLYGEQTGTIELELKDNTTISAKINVEAEEGADAGAIAGGAIGHVTDSNFNLLCNGVVVNGSITSNVTKYAYIGGLIGVVGPESYMIKTIEIQKLVYESGFQIKAEKAISVCGGLLGSVWSNTKIVLKGDEKGNPALLVKDATIQAPKANVGGLLYRSSGTFEIDEYGIEMSKLVVNAGNDVGLLVCHGERGKETISASKGDANSGDKQVVGPALYLFTTADWDTAYKIENESVEITQSGAVFDEFVAYTASSAEKITNNGSNENIVEEGNGIISLATKGREGVNPQSNNCTTYQNRTQYGAKKPTNACSRYYYDIDNIIKNIKNQPENNRIDTPEELLIWSIYQYADKGLKNNFVVANTDINSETHIIGGAVNADGTANGEAAQLDMAAYSYYPINLDRKDVIVQNAKITFHNDRIEAGEKQNKSTVGTTTEHTQHYTMHCGLFLNHQLGDNDTTQDGTSVNRVTFSGSIGKVNGGSGALFAGNIQGARKDSQIIKAKLSIKNVTFDNLAVNDCGEEYAPLLINSVGSYSDISVDTISTSGYTEGKAVASSMMGNVGTPTADQINLSFANIKLPDKKADDAKKEGIFSHASLLERFQYASNSSATYNFYWKDDWTVNGTEKSYNHANVTYGAEISETQKYPELQKWYYDEELNRTDDGIVMWSEDGGTTWSDKFTGYLPYVYNYNATDKNKKSTDDEIKVNQRTFDILTGCGTYGHPFVIKTEGEAKAISEYISTGKPVQDWRIRIIKDQSELCNAGKNTKGENDEYVMQYDGESWKEVEQVDGNWIYKTDGKELVTGSTPETDVMRLYIANAYYDFQGEPVTTSTLIDRLLGRSETRYQLVLTDFQGFGATSVCPFRGVITSTTGATVVLKGAKTGNGLIPYSYGSVVTNLGISYGKTDTKTMSLSSEKTLTYDQKSTYSPDSFFGGVIGCILGGDNIIDNVTMEMEKRWLGLSGEKNYLIPVGGYVGCISGGGVIFRNMDGKSGLSQGTVIRRKNQDDTTSDTSSDTSSDTTFDTSLYVNPYVGRVLDGFAFSEKCEIDNTDKNYKINQLDTNNTGSVVTTGGDAKDSDTGTFPFNVVVKDAQGLLVLSAVINSGATAGGDNTVPNATTPATGTNAYRGKINDTSASGYSFGNGVYGKVRNASYQHIGQPVDVDAVLDFSMAQNDEIKAPGSGNTKQVGKSADTLNTCTNAPYLIRKYCNDATFYITGGTYRSMNITLSKNQSDNTVFDMSKYGTGYQGLGARYRANAGQYISGTEGKIGSNCIIPTVMTFDGQGAIIKVDVNVKEYYDDAFHVASVGGIFNLFRSGKTEIRSVTVEGTKNSDEDYDILLAYENTNNGDVSSNIGAGGIVGSDAGACMTSGSITMSNVHVQNLNINGPVVSGGLIGQLGLIATGGDEGIKALIGGTNYKVDVQLSDCSYQNLKVTGKYKAGGLAGYIASSLSNNSSSIKIQKSGGADSIIETTAEKDTGKDSSVAGGLIGSVDADLYVNSEESESYTVVNNVEIISKQHAGGVAGTVTKGYSVCKVQVGNNTEIKSGTTYASDTYKDANGAPTAGGIIGKADGGSGGSVEQCIVEGVTIVPQASSPELVNKHQSSGGIIGRINVGKTTIKSCEVLTCNIKGGRSGGIVGQTGGKTTSVDLTLEKCRVEGEKENSLTIQGNDVTAGLVAFVKNGSVTMRESYLRYSKVETPELRGSNYGWGAGSFIGDVEGNPTFNIYDCAAESSEIIARNAGGMMGKCGTGEINASDVLLNGITINGWGEENNTGILIGSKVTNINLKMAGLSLHNIKAMRKSNPVTGLFRENLSGDEGCYKGYITFADYTGASTEGNKVDKVINKEDNALSVKDSVAPYVVSSPKASIQVKLGDDTAFLYGDGSSGSADNGFSYAKKIIEEGQTAQDGHFAYTKTGVSSTEFNLDNYTSTYNDNQSVQVKENFPVLLISSGTDVAWMEDYLNILTNGGYGEAKTLGSSLEVTTYACVKESDSEIFEMNDEIQPALQVSKDSSGKVSSFQTNATDYDNTKDRFTLLAVTFKAGEGQYNLYVPIIVRRQMEVDFTATLDYGTQFDKTTYNDIPADAHLLESFGSTFTGYLTYDYNSVGGEYADYGWQNFIDAGGNVANPLKKALVFSPMDTMNPYLPQGTQLSLIDCQNGDKVYYYTVSDNQTNRISLSDFTDASGSGTTSGKAFVEASIGELLGIQVSSNDSGKFIEVDENGKPVGASGTTEDTYSQPTVRVSGRYYRLAQSDESTYQHYSVVIDESGLSENNKSVINENYYIVITIPKSASQAVVGALQTSFSNADIPVRLHYRLRKKDEKNNTWTDSHNNTPSTYSISGGYTQKLKENSEQIVLPASSIADGKEISMTDSRLYIDVEDTITFPNNQVYNDSDELYLQFIGGMQKKENDEVNSIQFPNGTTGEVQFYVYTKDADGNIDGYYVYENETWKKSSKSATEAVPMGESYIWSASDGTMKLPLSVSGKENAPVSLKGIRKLLQNNTSQTSTFYVRAKMVATLPGTALGDIPFKEMDGNALKNFAKMTYSAQVSTKPESLSYSNNRAYASDTKVKYYREEPKGAKLTYDAVNINQLGINLLDLEQNLDKDKQYAVIETTAIYDLSTIEELKDVLSKSSGVRFSMTLSQKLNGEGNQEGYSLPFSLNDLTQNQKERYLDIQLNSPGSGTVSLTEQNGAGTWTWTIPKSTYCDKDGNLISGSVYDVAKNVFSQAILLKVRVDDVEQLEHFYANYKVELKAEVLDQNNNTSMEATDNIIYTLTKIKPEFVDQSNSN